MSRDIPDDRRYMSHELRAADDPRYRGELRREAPAAEMCSCGKTVLRTHGRPVMLDGKAVECPRRCGESAGSGNGWTNSAAHYG